MILGLKIWGKHNQTPAARSGEKIKIN